MRPASVAFTLLAVVAVSAQPGQGTLRIKVTLVDAAQAPTPVRRHALLVSDDPPTAAPRQIFTAADGTVVSDAAILGLLGRISERYRWMDVQKLTTFGPEEGFTRAQGE